MVFRALLSDLMEKNTIIYSPHSYGVVSVTEMYGSGRLREALCPSLIHGVLRKRARLERPCQ